MNDLLGNIAIKVNENVYSKNPESSTLGGQILSVGAQMINEMGLEAFTFGKLAKALSTTESSIYRYFESKQKLLLYLTCWYWGWLEYQLVFATANIDTSEKKLRIAVDVITADHQGKAHNGLNIATVQQLVIAESCKAYMNKDVDAGNREGYYRVFKRMVHRISEILLEINPNFEHPHTLVSTVFEGAHHQKYFAQHLPSLTDFAGNSEKLADFYFELMVATTTKNMTS